MENEVIDSGNGQGIVGDNEIRGYLTEISKWTKFLSIVGFVVIGLIVLVALFAGSVFSSNMGAMRSAGIGFSPVVITVILLDRLQLFTSSLCITYTIFQLK